MALSTKRWFELARHGQNHVLKEVPVLSIAVALTAPCAIDAPPERPFLAHITSGLTTKGRVKEGQGEREREGDRQTDRQRKSYKRYSGSGLEGAGNHDKTVTCSSICPSRAKAGNAYAPCADM